MIRALPRVELPSFACAVHAAPAAPLRTGRPQMLGIVRDARLMLPRRALADDELDEAAAAVRAARP